MLAATLAIVLVNLLTMLCFASDKARAVTGERRVRESHLLTLAALGGSPGAFAARRLFRHKTRKQPFSTQLWVIAAVQTGIGASFLF